MQRHVRFAFLTAAIASAFIPAFAQALTGITAEEAFDAVQTQHDPLSGVPANVALVDVRTRAEYVWVGAPAKVNEIQLKSGAVMEPDDGKVKLVNNGGFLEYSLLEYRVNGRPKWTPISKVAKIDTSPIAMNIPYKLWDEKTATTSINSEFDGQIRALADSGVEVLIVFCRSGSRSSSCGTQIESSTLYKFYAVYEIDDDDQTPGSGGVGGFEGSPYGEVYNGYHGFPGRMTGVQAVPSVSWKDTGLPIKIGIKLDPLP
jgi:rhodanese-related sulfurtransferase